MQQPNPESLKEFDTLLVTAAKDINILARLSWPAKHAVRFVEKLKAGKRPSLPKISYSVTSFEKEKEALQKIIAECDQGSAPGRFVVRTAMSYYSAIGMLESVGQPRFSEISISLYGSPNEGIPGSTLSHLEAAKSFIEQTSKFAESCSISEDKICILPETVRAAIDERCSKVFGPRKIAVEIDPELSSKAAAGATRIRLRSSTCYSDADIDQLVEHEALVHSLTALNGRAQENLQSLSLGAPRTTRTQEGLALFAEIITNSIDLQRLRRIALRVVAVQMGLDGADFYEVFQFFLDAGQSKTESFHSAARVFRGGDLKGGVVFTKDVGYLTGLSEVHTFMRKAVQEGRPELIRLLIAGRLTLSDTLELAESFESGFITQPLYRPDWLERHSQLVSFLMYSNFTNAIDLNAIKLSELR